MSCEFTPQSAGQQPARVAPHRPCGSNAMRPVLTAAEVEALEHDELDAEGRTLLAWALALLAMVAAFAFVLGYLAAHKGWL